MDQCLVNCHLRAVDAIVALVAPTEAKVAFAMAAAGVEAELFGPLLAELARQPIDNAAALELGLGSLAPSSGPIQHFGVNNAPCRFALVVLKIHIQAMCQLYMESSVS